MDLRTLSVASSLSFLSFFATLRPAFNGRFVRMLPRSLRLVMLMIPPQAWVFAGWEKLPSLGLSSSNPSGVRGKEALIAQRPVGIHCYAETQLSSVSLTPTRKQIQHLGASQQRICGFLRGLRPLCARTPCGPVVGRGSCSVQTILAVPCRLAAASPLCLSQDSQCPAFLGITCGYIRWSCSDARPSPGSTRGAA